MNPGMYSQLAKIEDSHWWFVSRRKLVDRLFAPLATLGKAKGLDVGCGTGGSLKFLKKYCSDLTGLEISKLALQLAKKKSPRNKFIQGNANCLSKLFPKESFTLITIFNVLYHQWILSETKVLKQAYNILKPKGYLVITEPAFNFLKRKHDVLDMGKRRYQIALFQKLIKDCGFIVVSSTYFNSISFVPALIASFVDSLMKRNKTIYKTEGAGELQIPPLLVNKILIKLMSIETNIIDLLGKIPLGVSLLIIAQKPALNNC